MEVTVPVNWAEGADETRALNGQDQVHAVLGGGADHRAVIQLGELAGGLDLNALDGTQGAAGAVILVIDQVPLLNGVGHILPDVVRRHLIGDGGVGHPGAGVGQAGVLHIQGGGHHQNHQDHHHVDDADLAKQAAVFIHQFHLLTPSRSMAMTGPLAI